MKGGRMNETIGTVLAYILIALIFGASLLLIRWQFNLCYPEISDNIWYCIKHAY